MKTSKIGKTAETAVSFHLQAEGYEVLDRNWRAKVCEIDIIARKDGIVFFVEVKYRGRNEQGGGFDYITPKKLAQMEFAARVWCSASNWEGDYRLIAAAVDGVRFEKVEIIEL